jgi:hypothetical protein
VVEGRRPRPDWTADLVPMALKYRYRQPRRLASRNAFLRTGDPIDLGRFVASYLQDPQGVRHHLEEHLRAVIQALIKTILTPPARGE